jgi:CBS domain-containing protein
MRTVADVMTRSVISVRPDAPLKDVARLMVDHSISGVPVVDGKGAVVGMVSEADLLMKEQGPEAIEHRRFARLLGESRATRTELAKIAATTAAEAMTSPAITVESGRTVQRAAATMVDRHVKRLAVVDDGKLVGIVTRADLIRAFVRSDEELATAIRDDVLLHVLWLNPVLFDVIVENGQATIRGRVERKSTAEMIQRVVGMVPGIVDVLVSVTWEVDDTRIEAPERDRVLPTTQVR